MIFIYIFLITELPELTKILPESFVNAFLAHKEHGDSGIPLKQVFSSLMNCEKAVIAASLNTLLERLEKEGILTQLDKEIF